jgi:hypothetical protein
MASSYHQLGILAQARGDYNEAAGFRPATRSGGAGA